MHIYTYTRRRRNGYSVPRGCEQVLAIEDYVGFFSKTLELSDQSHLEKVFNIFHAPRESCSNQELWLVATMAAFATA